jgi:hypothetical protein
MYAHSDDRQKDPVNLKILKQLVEKRASIPYPKVGDYIKTKDGVYDRISVIHQNGTCQGTRAGSFHLHSFGQESFSGGPNMALFCTASLKSTQETREGEIWFFDQGIVGADRGIWFPIQERVFEL